MNSIDTPESRTLPEVIPSRKLNYSTEDINRILQDTESDDRLFQAAIDHLYLQLKDSLAIPTLKENYAIDIAVEKKLIEYIRSHPSISRNNNSHLQTKDILAFHVWLLGSKDGKLFTKVKNANDKETYAFVLFIRDLLSEWEPGNEEKCEIIVLKLGEIFRFVNEFIETKLPNPFSQKEIIQVYTVTMKFINEIRVNYTNNGRSPFGERILQKTANNLINNYGAYIEGRYTPDLVTHVELANQKLSSFLHEEMLSVLLEKSKGIRPATEEDRKTMDILDEIRAKKSGNAGIIRDRRITPEMISWIKMQFNEKDRRRIEFFEKINYSHRITCRFRLAWVIAASKSSSAHEKESAYSTMIEIFYLFFSKRNTGGTPWDHNVALASSDPNTCIPEFYTLDGFVEIFKLYTPLFLFGGNNWATDANGNPTNRAWANRAELDAFTNTFRVLPDSLVPFQDLSWLLDRIVTLESYHPMIECQEYILLIIDEILRRINIGGKHSFFPDELLTRLETYLKNIPSPYMHVDFVARIYIHLANSFVQQQAGIPVVSKNSSIAKAAQYFTTAIGQMGAMDTDERDNIVLELGFPFLMGYYHCWLADNLLPEFELTPSSLSIISPKHYARQGLRFLTYGKSFTEYVKQSNKVCIRKLQEFSIRSFDDIVAYCKYIKDTVSESFYHVFEVEFWEEQRFQEPLGDIYTYPVVYFDYWFSTRIFSASDQLAKLLPGPLTLPEKYKITDGFITRHIHETIHRSVQNITSPESFAMLKTTEEIRQIRKNENESWSQRRTYIDKSRIAMYMRLFLDKNNPPQFDIFKQNKVLEGTIVGSELLVRFKNPDCENPPNGEYLFLDEVFAVLDLFKIYPQISRMIVSKGFAAGNVLTEPISVNTRWDEYTAKDYADFLIQEAMKNNLDPSRITLEILEHHSFDILEEVTIGNLRKLKTMWFHFALDDFWSESSFHKRFDQVVKEGTYTPEESIFSTGDEIKFDAVYKNALQNIIDIIDETYSTSVSGLPQELRNFNEIYNLVSDHPRLNTSTLAFLNMIATAHIRHIKPTIEQIEPNEGDLLMLAQMFGLTVQGYIHHRPEKVEMATIRIHSVSEKVDAALSFPLIPPELWVANP